MESDIFVPDSQDEEPDPIRIQACKLRFLNARRCPTILSAKLKGPFRTSPFAATYRHLDSDDETLGTTFTYRRNDAFPAEAPIHINPPSTGPNNTVEPSTASPFRKAIVTKRTQKTANLCFITTPDIRDQRATKKTSTSEGESHAKRNGVSQRLLRSHHKDLDGHDPTAKAFRLEQYIESMNEPELPQTTDFNSTLSERTLSSDITALLSKSLRPTVVSTKERGHTTYTPQSDVENPDSPSLDCAGKEIAEIDTKEQQRYPIDQFSLSSPLLEERGFSPSTNKGSLASSSPPAIIVTETWTKDVYDLGQLSDEDLYVGRRRKRRLSAASKAYSMKTLKLDSTGNIEATSLRQNILHQDATPESHSQIGWSSSYLGVATSSPQKTLQQIAISPSSSPQGARGRTIKWSDSATNRNKKFDIDERLADIESFLVKDIDYQTRAVGGEGQCQ